MCAGLRPRQPGHPAAFAGHPVCRAACVYRRRYGQGKRQGSSSGFLGLAHWSLWKLKLMETLHGMALGMHGGTRQCPSLRLHCMQHAQGKGQMDTYLFDPRKASGAGASTPAGVAAEFQAAAAAAEHAATADVTVAPAAIAVSAASRDTSWTAPLGSLLTASSDSPHSGLAPAWPGQPPLAMQQQAQLRPMLSTESGPTREHGADASGLSGLSRSSGTSPMLSGAGAGATSSATDPASVPQSGPDVPTSSAPSSGPPPEVGAAPGLTARQRNAVKRRASLASRGFSEVMQNLNAATPGGMQAVLQQDQQGVSAGGAAGAQDTSGEGRALAGPGSRTLMRRSSFVMPMAGTGGLGLGLLPAQGFAGQLASSLGAKSSHASPPTTPSRLTEQMATKILLAGNEHLAHGDSRRAVSATDLAARAAVLLRGPVASTPNVVDAMAAATAGAGTKAAGASDPSAAAGASGASAAAGASGASASAAAGAAGSSTVAQESVLSSKAREKMADATTLAVMRLKERMQARTEEDMPHGDAAGGKASSSLGSSRASLARPMPLSLPEGMAAAQALLNPSRQPGSPSAGSSAGQAGPPSLKSGLALGPSRGLNSPLSAASIMGGLLANTGRGAGAAGSAQAGPGGGGQVCSVANVAAASGGQLVMTRRGSAGQIRDPGLGDGPASRSVFDIPSRGEASLSSLVAALYCGTAGLGGTSGSTAPSPTLHGHGHGPAGGPPRASYNGLASQDPLAAAISIAYASREGGTGSNAGELLGHSEEAWEVWGVCAWWCCAG